jgi:hypothetical protein
MVNGMERLQKTQISTYPDVFVDGRGRNEAEVRAWFEDYHL